MSYFPNVPQPNDIPADTQDEFLMNYDTLNTEYGINHIPFGNTITEVTQASPTVFTSPNHRLTSGDTIQPFHMYGINEITGRASWPDTINNTVFAVTVLSDDTFSIVFDSTSLDTYEPSSGNYLVTSTYPYGYHTQLNFSRPLPSSPDLVAPKSSVFVKENIVSTLQADLKSYEEVITNELFHQSAPILLDFLTNNDFRYGATAVTTNGFITPWGIKVNLSNEMSFYPDTGLTKIFTYAIPYTTTNYFTIVTRYIDTSTTDLRVTASDLVSFTVTRGAGPAIGPRFSVLSMGI